MDPIIQIKNDRSDARKLGDTNADTCFLALADNQGKASVRTLVLRDIVENRFVLFMNRTSPKFKAFKGGADFELLLWYSSVQRQYRIRGEMQELAPDVAKGSWQRRPQGSKYLDYVYQEMAHQSSEIVSRDLLVAELGRLKSTYKSDDMQAPEAVTGVELIARQIDMLDLNREDRIHDRRLFELQDGNWQARVLVP